MVQTKFNINDTVYIVNDNSIVETKIRGLKLDQEGKENYLLTGYMHGFDGEIIYKDIEECVEDLKSNVREPTEVSKKVRDLTNNLKNKLFNK